MQKIRASLSVGAIGVALVLSSVATSALAEKPKNWPSNRVWHDYSQTAPKPVFNGPVRTFDAGSGLNGVDFKTLPLQHAIVRVRGNGERKIAVFVDPLCPYSKVLEENLNQADNVTIYTFVAPTLNRQKSSKNWEVSNAILCSSTDNKARAEAYESWFFAGAQPKAQIAGCEATIQSVLRTLDSTRLVVRGGVFGSRSPSIMFEKLNIGHAGALQKKTLDTLLNI